MEGLLFPGRHSDRVLAFSPILGAEEALRAEGWALSVDPTLGRGTFSPIQFPFTVQKMSPSLLGKTARLKG